MNIYNLHKVYWQIYMKISYNLHKVYWQNRWVTDNLYNLTLKIYSPLSQDRNAYFSDWGIRELWPLANVNGDLQQDRKRFRVMELRQ